MPSQAEIELFNKVTKLLHGIWHQVLPGKKLPHQYNSLTPTENPYQLNNDEYVTFIIVINSLLGILNNLYAGAQLQDQEDTSIFIVQIKDAQGHVQMEKPVTVHMKHHIFGIQKQLIPRGAPRAQHLVKQLIEEFINAFENVYAAGNVKKFIGELGLTECVDGMTNKAIHYGRSSASEQATVEFSEILAKQVVAQYQEKFKQRYETEDLSYYFLLATLLKQFFNVPFKADFGNLKLRNTKGAFDAPEFSKGDLYKDIALAIKTYHLVEPKSDFVLAAKEVPKSLQDLFLELVFRGDPTLLPTADDSAKNIALIKGLLNFTSEAEQNIFDELMTQINPINDTLPINLWESPNNLLALAVWKWKLPDEIITAMLQHTSDQALIKCVINANILMIDMQLTNIAKRLSTDQFYELLSKSNYFMKTIDGNYIPFFKSALETARQKLSPEKLTELVLAADALNLALVDENRFQEVLICLCTVFPKEQFKKLFDTATIQNIIRIVKSPAGAVLVLNALARTFDFKVDGFIGAVCNTLAPEFQPLYLAMALRSYYYPHILKVTAPEENTVFDTLMQQPFSKSPSSLLEMAANVWGIDVKVMIQIFKVMSSEALTEAVKNIYLHPVKAEYWPVIVSRLSAEQLLKIMRSNDILKSYILIFFQDINSHKKLLITLLTALKAKLSPQQLKTLLIEADIIQIAFMDAPNFSVLEQFLDSAILSAAEFREIISVTCEKTIAHMLLVTDADDFDKKLILQFLVKIYALTLYDAITVNCSKLPKVLRPLFIRLILQSPKLAIPALEAIATQQDRDEFVSQIYTPPFTDGDEPRNLLYLASVSCDISNEVLIKMFTIMSMQKLIETLIELGKYANNFTFQKALSTLLTREQLQALIKRLLTQKEMITNRVIISAISEKLTIEAFIKMLTENIEIPPSDRGDFLALYKRIPEPLQSLFLVLSLEDPHFADKLKIHSSEDALFLSKIACRINNSTKSLLAVTIEFECPAETLIALIQHSERVDSGEFFQILKEGKYLVKSYKNLQLLRIILDTAKRKCSPLQFNELIQTSTLLQHSILGTDDAYIALINLLTEYLDKNTLLVMIEPVILYLCSHSASKLAALFDCFTAKDVTPACFHGFIRKTFETSAWKKLDRARIETLNQKVVTYLKRNPAIIADILPLFLKYAERGVHVSFLTAISTILSHEELISCFIKINILAASREIIVSDVIHFISKTFNKLHINILLKNTTPFKDSAPLNLPYSTQQALITFYYKNLSVNEFLDAIKRIQAFTPHNLTATSKLIYNLIWKDLLSPVEKKATFLCLFQLQDWRIRAALLTELLPALLQMTEQEFMDVVTITLPPNSETLLSIAFELHGTSSIDLTHFWSRTSTKELTPLLATLPVWYNEASLELLMKKLGAKALIELFKNNNYLWDLIVHEAEAAPVTLEKTLTCLSKLLSKDVLCELILASNILNKAAANNNGKALRCILNSVDSDTAKQIIAQSGVGPTVHQNRELLQILINEFVRLRLFDEASDHLLAIEDLTDEQALQILHSSKFLSLLATAPLDTFSLNIFKLTQFLESDARFKAICDAEIVSQLQQSPEKLAVIAELFNDENEDYSDCFPKALRDLAFETAPSLLSLETVSAVFTEIFSDYFENFSDKPDLVLATLKFVLPLLKARFPAQMLLQLFPLAVEHFNGAAFDAVIEQLCNQAGDALAELDVSSLVSSIPQWDKLEFLLRTLTITLHRLHLKKKSGELLVACMDLPDELKIPALQTLLTDATFRENLCFATPHLQARFDQLMCSKINDTYFIELAAMNWGLQSKKITPLFELTSPASLLLALTQFKMLWSEWSFSVITTKFSTEQLIKFLSDARYLESLFSNKNQPIIDYTLKLLATKLSATKLVELLDTQKAMRLIYKDNFESVLAVMAKHLDAESLVDLMLKARINQLLAKDQARLESFQKFLFATNSNPLILGQYLHRTNLLETFEKQPNFAATFEKIRGKLLTSVPAATLLLQTVINLDDENAVFTVLEHAKTFFNSDDLMKILAGSNILGVVVRLRGREHVIKLLEIIAMLPLQHQRTLLNSCNSLQHPVDSGLSFANYRELCAHAAKSYLPQDFLRLLSESQAFTFCVLPHHQQELVSLIYSSLAKATIAERQQCFSTAYRLLPLEFQQSFSNQIISTYDVATHKDAYENLINETNFINTVARDHIINLLITVNGLWSLKTGHAIFEILTIEQLIRVLRDTNYLWNVYNLAAAPFEITSQFGDVIAAIAQKYNPAGLAKVIQETRILHKATIDTDFAYVLALVAEHVPLFPLLEDLNLMASIVSQAAKLEAFLRCISRTDRSFKTALNVLTRYWSTIVADDTLLQMVVPLIAKESQVISAWVYMVTQNCNSITLCKFFKALHTAAPETAINSIQKSRWLEKTSLQTEDDFAIVSQFLRTIPHSQLMTLLKATNALNAPQSARPQVINYIELLALAEMIYPINEFLDLVKTSGAFAFSNNDRLVVMLIASALNKVAINEVTTPLQAAYGLIPLELQATFIEQLDVDLKPLLATTPDTEIPSSSNPYPFTTLLTNPWASSPRPTRPTADHEKIEGLKFG